MALTSVESIDAQVKQLEAQKKLIENRDSDVSNAMATLQKYAQVLTLAQRRQVAKLVGQSVAAPAAAPLTKKASAKKGVAKGTKLGPVASKY
jgi:DNA-binding protein H-NS